MLERMGEFLTTDKERVLGQGIVEVLKGGRDRSRILQGRVLLLVEFEAGDFIVSEGALLLLLLLRLCWLPDHTPILGVPPPIHVSVSDSPLGALVVQPLVLIGCPVVGQGLPASRLLCLVRSSPSHLP